MYQDIFAHENYLKTLLWQKVKSNKLFYYCEEYKVMFNFTYSRQASNLLIVIHLLSNTHSSGIWTSMSLELIIFFHTFKRIKFVLIRCK